MASEKIVVHVHAPRVVVVCEHCGQSRTEPYQVKEMTHDEAMAEFDSYTARDRFVEMASDGVLHLYPFGKQPWAAARP